MDKVLMIKYGEIALKGMNKPYFERVLIERIRKAIKSYPEASVWRYEGVVFARTADQEKLSEMAVEISKVFGVATVSIAAEVESDPETIFSDAAEYMKEIRKEQKIYTFKVEAKRSNKQFPIISPEIARKAGGSILKACNDDPEYPLRVNVHEPDCMLFVDVRRDKTYIYHDKLAGFGGLPLGTNGKGLVLLSGGIDSPVASWMMAKRGMNIEAIHFHSYPFTSDRAKEKVLDLAKILSGYCGRIKVHCVNLLEIQQAINENCPEEQMTILSRRFMMKIAERLAHEVKADVLITGENIGQVASQTVQGLVVTDNAVQLPVMRPLIAMDKVDIMEIAQKIGTFETSIQPFEDCCTVFLPKHPLTKPKLETILESEKHLDAEQLIENALAGMENYTINP
ncbi:MAG: tRNA 4-thiouridine(8) synthase ThiI [Clostridiales bacterium]|nr:tRNA 4-thiouridine(8) synthase ThiI [Clostridiales bacterium]